MTPDEIKQLDPDELLEFLRSAESLSDEQIRAAEERMSGVAERDSFGNVTGDSSELMNALERLKEGESTDAMALAQQEVARRQIAAITNKAPLDLSDIKDMAPDTVDSAEFAREALEGGRELAKKQLSESARQSSDISQEEADEVAERQVGETDALGLGSTPNWILQQTGAELTEDQKARAVEYWNDMHGTWQIIDDFDTDLLPLLQEPSAPAQMVMEAALLGVEPAAAIQFDLPGRDPFTLSQPAVEAAQQLYGLSNDSLIRLVRLTAMMNDPDDDVGDLWQPMAAILAATGRADDLAQQEAERQAGSDDEDPEDPSAAEQVQVARAKGIPLSAVPGYETGTPDAGTTVPDYLKGDDIISDPDEGIDPGFASFGSLQMYFKEGLDQYNGSQTLAFIHAIDRGLAARLAASGGDPGKVSGADNAEAIRLLVKGGIISRGTTPFESIGGTADDVALAYLKPYFDSLFTEEQLKAQQEAESRAAQIRAMPDPIMVGEQFKALWENLFPFMPEPSENLVSAFQQELEGAINAAPPEQNVDVSARIQAFIRGQDTYKDLYGNKPEGLSESQYQQQFFSGSTDMLGSEAPDGEAILAGMRSGNYQTTIGAIAGSKDSLDNSTFQERLANRADTIAQMT